MSSNILLENMEVKTVKRPKKPKTKKPKVVQIVEPEINWNDSNPFSQQSSASSTTTPKPKRQRLKKHALMDLSKEEFDNRTIDIPIVGQTTIAIPEFFATPYIFRYKDKETGEIMTTTRYKLVNPLSKARNLATRKHRPTIKLIRKPIEDAVIMEGNDDSVPLSAFSTKDIQIINKHFPVVDENRNKAIENIPNTKPFDNKERGRPEVMERNIKINRKKGIKPNKTFNVYQKVKTEGQLLRDIAREEEEADNYSPPSSYSPPSTTLPTPPVKQKRAYKRVKPLKYANDPEGKAKALALQKKESAKLILDTEKYGLEEALRLKAEKRQQDKESGNDWVKGLVDDIAEKSEKKPKKLTKKAEQQIAQQIARGAHAGGASGSGIKEKNIIFSNVIMPSKGKKVCSECGMKNCGCSDNEDIEGMGLYASGGGLYASGGGLYASGGQPPSRGRGIKHMHHFHRTEMTGEGIVHHHHHMEGGKISMKSIGADIKKAFSPVQKAFEPVKQAFDKVEDVAKATPYNAEVLGHYLIPAAGSAVGGAAGSVIGGPLGGIVGSAGGAYGGNQLQKELGYDDNTTFKGFGMKHKKGSAEAKEWGRRMREARLAKQNK
jgi:uncharacterized membrane protein